MSISSDTLFEYLGLEDLSSEHIEDFLDKNIDKIVAGEMKRVLEEKLSQLQRNSHSGSLDGYEVQVEVYRREYKVFKKRVKLANIIVARVVASNHHQSLGINVFDILDSGRKRLPRKTGKKSFYVLPSLGDAHTRTKGPYWSVRTPMTNPFRAEPRLRSNNIYIDPNTGATTWPKMSRGPIRAVRARNFYRRALYIAEQRIRKSLKPILKKYYGKTQLHFFFYNDYEMQRFLSRSGVRRKR